MIGQSNHVPVNKMAELVERYLDLPNVEVRVKPWSIDAGTCAWELNLIWQPHTGKWIWHQRGEVPEHAEPRFRVLSIEAGLEAEYQHDQELLREWPHRNTTGLDCVEKVRTAKLSSREDAPVDNTQEIDLTTAWTDPLFIMPTKKERRRASRK